MIRLLAVMPEHHAKARADRREALHRHGECDGEGKEKALEAMGHVLKLYYRRDGNRRIES
jgi:hypothetical protein